MSVAEAGGDHLANETDLHPNLMPGVLQLAAFTPPNRRCARHGRMTATARSGPAGRPRQRMIGRSCKGQASRSETSGRV